MTSKSRRHRPALVAAAAAVTLLGVQIGAASSAVSGRILYVSYPTTPIGLDYHHPAEKPVRGARVLLLRGPADRPIAETTTAADGSFVFDEAGGPGSLRVFVLAQTIDPPIRVEDNTDEDRIWAVESPPFGRSGHLDLLIPSGWDGTVYSGPRLSAPFAVLDAAWTAAMAFRAVRDVSFPELRINWSENNRPERGSRRDGQIETSFWDGEELYLLGKADVDTDEFDLHVIVHEWGHYFEDKVARSDGIGGAHSLHEVLDPRVAFGEGWGNALSAMILYPRTRYIDTVGPGQRSAGVQFELEDNGFTSHPGWYSEASVQSVLFDVFDPEDDGADRLSLGLGPIYDVMTGPQKKTVALTTIFSFVKGLSDLHPDTTGALDTLVTQQGIVPIRDVFGIGETNDGGSPTNLPLYHETAIDHGPLALELDGHQGSNKLGQNRFVAFAGDGSEVRVTATTTHDVLLRVYQRGTVLGESDRVLAGTEEVKVFTLPERLYIINVTGFETEGRYLCTVDVERR